MVSHILFFKFDKSVAGGVVCTRRKLALLGAYSVKLAADKRVFVAKLFQLDTLGIFELFNVVGKARFHRFYLFFALVYDALFFCVDVVQPTVELPALFRHTLQPSLKAVRSSRKFGP